MIVSISYRGTFDPGTGNLAMTGDVPMSLFYPCNTTCTVILMEPLTFNGSIDPAHSTGAGQIKWGVIDASGDWQIP